MNRERSSRKSLEHRATEPDGYSLSRFCELYGAWRGRVSAAMRQRHVAGEKMFVAVLGASSYTYAEATWSQQLPDWIGSHVRALTFLDGCPKVIVPDNLKSGVNKPCFFEPKINRTYASLASHYGTVVIPARSRRPKDKSKVEDPVCSRIAAKILHDEPDLRSFAPAGGEIDKHYYSVPHGLIKQQVTARITATTIELFHRGRRAASHLRSRQQRRHTTIREHMPSAHRRYAGWTHERLQQDAESIGPHTACLIEAILKRKPHPEQGFRACLGILRLRKSYGPDRLEAACGRAFEINGLSYSSVASILKNNIDRRRRDPAADEGPVIYHQHLRGPTHFQ